MKTATKSKKTARKAIKADKKVTAPVKAAKGKDDTPKLVRLKPDHTKYHHAAKTNGHKAYDIGDEVASFCRSLELHELFKVLKAFGVEGLQDKYGHLNNGMQRMNLGNKLRGILQREKFEKVADALSAHELELVKIIK